MTDNGGSEQEKMERLERAASEGDIERLLESLEDRSPTVRVSAVSGLGTVGGDRARLVLLAIARDRWGERPDIRIEALRALGRLYAQREYAELLQGFISAENRKVVAQARAMLAGADPEGYPSRLLSRGCTDHAAFKVYGKARLVEAVPLLDSFLDERIAAGDLLTAGNWGKAYAATRALANIGAPESVSTIDGLLAWLEDAGAEKGTLASGRADKLRAAARDARSAAGRNKHAAGKE